MGSISRVIMEQELKNYILWYCQEWMKPEEKKALIRLGFTKVNQDFEIERAKRNKVLAKYYGFNDEKISALIEMGEKKLELYIANRIFKNHEKEIINNCPKCGKLARTPKARQCRHCRFDWH